MSNADRQRKALGKGLSALLPSKPAGPPSPPQVHVVRHEGPPSEDTRGAVAVVSVSEIDANPFQPRSAFDDGRLQELAQSIRSNGILQPLVVRAKGERYELVAGERRWRAAILAGHSSVPVLIQEVADNRMLELALVENLQREDLNPIEAAQAFEKLSTELGLTHDEIGARTGKDRTSIANLIRLLKLPAEIQQLVTDRKLPMGQARALLRLPTSEQQSQIGNKAAAQGLSTRQVEALVQEMVEPRVKAREAQAAKHQDPNIRAAADELERFLGTRVRIVEQSDKKGRIEIEYYSADDLDRIYNLILGQAG